MQVRGAEAEGVHQAGGRISRVRGEVRVDEGVQEDTAEDALLRGALRRLRHGGTGKQEGPGMPQENGGVRPPVDEIFHFALDLGEEAVPWERTTRRRRKASGRTAAECPSRKKCPTAWRKGGPGQTGTWER